MATGFVQRFKGKIKAHAIWLASKGLADAVSGISFYPRGAVKLALAVTAVTNTDFTVQVPTGATIESLSVITTTAFGAVTDAVVTIGSTVGGNDYVTATSIKSAASHALTWAGTVAQQAVSPGPTWNVRVAQSGGNSATGAAVLVINFAAP